MNIRLAMPCFLTLMLTGPAALPLAAADGTVQLENEALAVSISLETGGIERVLRKATGYEHRNPDAPAEIVQLRIPLDNWDGHAVRGIDAQQMRVAERSATSLTLETARFRNPSGTWAANTRIEYRLEDDNLIVQLAIENRADRAIDRVVFPALGVPAAADGTEVLVTPSGPQPLAAWFSSNSVRTRHDPFERLDPSDLRGWIHADPAISSKAMSYPIGFNLLPTTWLSYELGPEAVGWDVRDRDFQTQFAVIERVLHRDTESAARNTRTYRMAWHWYPTIAPGASWRSPEVWLKFGDADWHRVARQHRVWFDSWAIKPQRPDAFKASLGWISHGVTDFDQIPVIARRGVEVGAPYFIVYGWYGYGMGRLSYDFHPRPILGGVESLRRNITAARELGGYPLAWFNGTTSVETRPEHQQFGKHWIVVDRAGGLAVDGRWSLFDPDRPQTADDNVVHFNFDMATPGRDYLLESVRRMIQDYGFLGFEMDQASKNYLSYRPGSGSGPERGSSEGTREIYATSMQIVRQANPDGIVVAEGISDFMGQYFDSFWIFEGGGDVFSAAEHWTEETSYIRYSVPHGLVPRRADPQKPGQANEAFLLNAPLDIFARLDDYPDYAAHLKRLHALKKATYPFLFGGLFSDREGFELSGHDPAAVLARSYREAARDTVVVINTGAEPRQAQVRFTAPGTGAVMQYRLDRPVAEPAGSGAITLQLKPHDVVVLAAEREIEREIEPEVER